VVEDDYDGKFRYGQRQIDALQAIDTEGRVIYVGTFSKALSPQMRLGCLVLPPARVPAFRQAKRLTDRHAPLLEQRVLASLIDGGTCERHVRRIRRENERRRAALLDAVARHVPGGTRAAGSAAGLHVVIWLPWLRARDEPARVEVARRRGVGVHPVSGLFARPTPPQGAKPAGLVVGYASLTPEQIRLGIGRLAGALADLPNAARIEPARKP